MKHLIEHTDHDEPAVHDGKDTDRLAPATGTRPAIEKLASSPRGAVAFSALSAVDWIAALLRGIAKKVRSVRAPSKANNKQPVVHVTRRVMHFGIALFLFSAAYSRGQQASVSVSSAAVPRLVSYSGHALDDHGKPIQAVAGITFAIYRDQQGGAPLWLETQNAKLDATGRYAVQLGSTKVEGLPLELFTSGEARWLGVRVNNGEEQPRVLLVSVPYALKAADAETIGGLPPSAFVLAAPTNGSSPASGTAPTSSPVQSSAAPTVSGTGTANYLPLWMDNSGTLGNSAIFQVGTAPTAKIGINLSSPVNALEVQGSSMMHGQFTMPSAGLATASAGKKSYPLDIRAASYNSSTHASVFQNFLWEAEPAANNTANPGGTLNLLFASGSASPAETGLKIASNGQINFASGQTFPGVITTVNAGSGLIEVVSGSAIALAVDATKVPLLNTANTFTGNQTVNGNLSATGVVSASAYQIGSVLFNYGNASSYNAFLGFSGNVASTGAANTAAGFGALQANTSGSINSAFGMNALFANTTGQGNTAVGEAAMVFNKTGSYNAALGKQALTANESGNFNTAIGEGALGNDQTGSFNTIVGADAMSVTRSGTSNTAVGYAAGGPYDGSLNTYIGYKAAPFFSNVTNSTGIGANAVVGASNAMILGGIKNNSVTVGIGTAAPYNDYALDVETINSNGIINGGVVVNASGGNLYLGMTNTTHKFRVDTNGTVYADGGLNASGADFAESVAVEGVGSSYEPGDVLEIDQRTNRHLALSRRPYATLVAGIYSTKPGVLASPHHIDEAPSATPEVPLAVVGIVPCKVTAENGAIARGDLLVTSSRPGYAMKGTDRKRMLGAVVGKALEPLAKGTGIVEVLVTLQ